MSTAVVDLRKNTGEAVRRAVTELQSGHLVVLPTETVYGVAACLDVAGAAQALMEAKGRPNHKPFTLALPDRDAALRTVPTVGAAGRRIIQRGLPGPLTLIVADALDDSPLGELDAESTRLISTDGSLGLRVPAHSDVQEVLHRTGRPVVLTSANVSGGSDATTAEEAVAGLGDAVALVVDGGPTQYRKSSTVVRVEGNGWRLLREGVVPAGTVQRLANFVILFVCAGNVCRSPMADGLCRRLLGERVGCRPEQLEKNGYCILSAGVSAEWGAPATEFAATVAREHGAELGNHVSQPLAKVLVEQSDLVLTMTAQQRQRVQTLAPGAADRAHLLDVDGHDIADPMGHDLEQYRDAARRIRLGIEHVLATWVP